MVGTTCLQMTHASSWNLVCPLRKVSPDHRVPQHPDPWLRGGRRRPGLGRGAISTRAAAPADRWAARGL